jgi:hypothetical protein
MFVDLHTEENTRRFKEASLYRKSAIVKARQVTEVEKVETVLANGFHETERDVPVGHWIITNPGGEEYAVSTEKFEARYESIGNGEYRAKGIIKAFRNFTGEDVEIVAPWGDPQYGDRDCLFATALDPQLDITSDRYIIGGQEFLDTYEPYGETA